jgi:hypothetical protein
MDILNSVQKNFAAIHIASGEYLTKLTCKDFKKDLSLAAEMAGLMLLRASPANDLKIASGTAILGAIPDDVSITLTRFVFGYAQSNGLNPGDLNIAGIPADAKNYLPELTQFEQPLYDVCQKHGIEKDLFPFTAAASAGKLVLAGDKLGLLKANIGLALLLYHIAAGSKTFPYPAHT